MNSRVKKGRDGVNDSGYGRGSTSDTRGLIHELRDGVVASDQRDNRDDWLKAKTTLKDLQGWSPILCAARLQSHQLLQLLHKLVGADSIPGFAEKERQCRNVATNSMER